MSKLSTQKPKRSWHTPGPVDEQQSIDQLREEVDRLIGAIDYLAHEGVISASKVREITEMTCEQQRRRWREGNAESHRADRERVRKKCARRAVDAFMEWYREAARDNNEDISPAGFIEEKVLATDLDLDATPTPEGDGGEC